MFEILRFLHIFSDAAYRAHCARYTEPDDEKFQQLVSEWDAMLAGGLRCGLVRPAVCSASLYACTDFVGAASRLRPSSVLAIARYQPDRADVYRAWMGDTEPGPRGEAMRERLHVSREDGRFKVAARDEVCGDCFGAGGQRTGQRCSACDGAGWFSRGGRQWRQLGRMLELRKLGPPTDQRYRRAYDAIG
ncbi:MAG: hypothetical protein E6J90_32925 [Deltaproteobacteria bacterium]|nr:MAG: hypothetical protein E6J90_32925 [Deltaproteobacteria bacterium]TMQ23294.1 MAG: hypothetical protein E6J91_00240 [Deltaproteobacteria bacterium]